MKRLFFILIFAISGLFFAFSQGISITGRLVDSDSGKPIEYATVQLLQLPDSVFMTGCVSSADGSFSMKSVLRDGM